MSKALKYINELNKQLYSLYPIKPEYRQKLDKKFRLEFNYNSNHIEGNTLTYGETELLLIFGETKGNHDKREYDEMEAHDVAYDKIKEWAQDKETPLTEMAIKNLNEIILVKPFWKDAITQEGQPTRRLIKIGDYKEYPNSVRLPNGQIFDYTSPADTPILMGELIEWYRTEEEKKELHPVALAALLHYKFVRIHPFDDGNGRISRLLVNYVLLKNDLPPVIIKSAKKTEYLHALHQADAGYIDEFIDYVAEQAMWSLEISIKAAKGESIDEPGDLDKKLKLFKQKTNLKEEIKEERSKDIIISSYTNSIKPFLDRVTETLKKFDNIFKSKHFQITVWDNSEAYITLPYEVDTTDDVVNHIDSSTNSIDYTYSLSDIRKKTTNKIVININIRVVFFQIVYEIKSKEINIDISKLYHEILDNKESEAIAEALGNNLLEKIEAAIQA